MVLPFLGERIRQASESALPHPQAEIGALHYRRADALRIRIADAWDYLRARDFGGRIPALGPKLEPSDPAKTVIQVNCYED